jgi:hypothetical protein
MESTKIALIALFVHVDDLCKENRWDFRHDLGRKFGLWLPAQIPKPGVFPSE